MSAALNRALVHDKNLEARGIADLADIVLCNFFWRQLEMARAASDSKENKMSYEIIPDGEALGQCAGCQGKIQEFDDVFDVGVKLKSGIDLSEFESHCIQLGLVSEKKSVYMLVTAKDSEAKQSGFDGLLLLCSEKCRNNFRHILEEEITAGTLFAGVQSDGTR